MEKPGAKRPENRVKSVGRGTKIFQVTGVDDGLYRAYRLQAALMGRSLNAELRLALEELMKQRNGAALTELRSGAEDEEVELNPYVPPDLLEAEINRRALLKAQELVGGTAARKAARAQPQQAETTNMRTERGTRPPPVNNLPAQPVEYKRHPWNPIGHWPGPGPAGTAIGDEWAAAGKPDYPEWDAMQKAKKEAAAYPPLPPAAEPPGVVPKVLLPPTTDPKYDIKARELYDQAARDAEEREK